MSGHSSATKKRKRSSNWDEGSERILIELYSDYFVQLETMSSKKPIYQKIANKLADRTSGTVEKTADQVLKKIKALKTKYKNEQPNPTGGEPSTWVHYDQMHKILHEKPAFNASVAFTSELGIDSDDDQRTGSPVHEGSPRADADVISENVTPERVSTPTPQRKVAQKKSSELAEVAKQTLEFLKEESTKRDDVRKNLESTNAALLVHLDRLATSSEVIAQAVSKSIQTK